MGASSSMLQVEELRQIHKETGFSNNQIIRLYSRFTSLDKSDQGFLRRAEFLWIPELAINPLGDRIVQAFFQESGSDTVNFRQFMRVLARFIPVKKDVQKNKLNSREEKLIFAFKMYDLDDDDLISREELINVLHMMVGDNISDDQLASIADRTLQDVDLDKDAFISREEFLKAMENVDVEQQMSIRFLN